MTPQCSIIVPTYSAAALLRECLTALLADLDGRPDAEVVVSDDGSTDDTTAVLDSFAGRIKVVRHAENRGFAHACNAGAAAAEGRLLVFYNNDLQPAPGWLDALLDHADRTTAKVIGSKLLFPDGRVQHAGVVLCSDGYPRHVYAGFPADAAVTDRSGPVRIVTGACLLTYASWFDRLGGFDLRYRNGYEDVDLCLRTAEAGGEVHYCHRSVLTHLVSASRENRVAEFAETEREFLSRWGRLPADDFARYVEDGLIRVRYGRTFPFQLEVSPELAVVRNSAEQNSNAVELLSQELHELRRENVRLRLRLAELEPRSTDRAGGRPH
jgi:GT2 family glycosyltransferase